MDLKRPKRLQPGDLVGVAATSSPIQLDLLQDGVRELESLGFRVRVLDSVDQRHLYMAGSDNRRAAEINEFLQDPEVRAVLCARGGYGWPRVLDMIDWAALARDPKPIVGFSDATVALAAAGQTAGTVSFHGPMVAWDLRQGSQGYDRDSFLRALTRVEPLGELTDPDLEVLQEGSAEGTLLGGCLSLLVSLLGTPWMPETKGSILFLEDWKSKPYQIDRMLQQLRHAGVLAGLAGVVFGQMLECRQQEIDTYTLQEVILECLQNGLSKGAPILYGLPSGHVDKPNLTLPLGVRARIVAEPENPALHILESAVSE